MDGSGIDWQKVLQGILPNRCLLCAQKTPRAERLCHYCRADLRFFDYSRFDNLLLRPDINDGLKNPKFERLISLAPYQWPFNQWIGDLKFREQFNLSQLLGGQLATLLTHLLSNNPQLRPDIVCPMPIHRQRRFIRGYNQSQLLSEVVCEALEIPINNNQLKRVKPTKAQSGLNNTERRANVKTAFSYDGPAYEHVAIIDDVITTGATVNALCSALKKRRVKTISVWTVCATPLFKAN